MKPSQPASAPPAGLHVGIIMDGNGRWATRQGRSRAAGHQAGAKAVRRLVEAAPELGIGTLTLFAFSSDNWQRPAREVKWLMRLFSEYLRAEAEPCAEEGVRLTVLGRRDRLSRTLLDAIDYSARDAILRAAQCVTPGTVPSREAFGRLLAIVNHGTPSAGPVDLLIRTGGERRLSDFLLWECAYAELCFVPTMWPDFGPDHLSEAVADFHRRERRFGALPDAAAS